MSLFGTNVDYSARDQRSLRLRLQGLIQSVFPTWTDFNNASFSNILLESVAFVGDNLAFYQDRQAGEMFWPTVTQRASAIRLGRLINFRLSSAQPAVATVRFSLAAPAVNDVLLPEGTRLRTTGNNAQRFRTIAAATIVVGEQYVDVEAEQAELVLGEAFTSSGAPNQKFVLQRVPVVDNTISVIADDGAYTEVRSFLDADPDTLAAIGPGSRVFVVRTDPLDRAILLFGNGVAGKIPEGTITANYKVGGGVDGNVDEDAISVVEDTIFDSLSQIVSVSVHNTTSASGGTNRMSVIEARAQGPRSLRVLERTVTRSDFELAALEVAGVARAVMVTSNEDAAVPENTGYLLVVARGARLASGRVAAATPSSALLASVLNQITVVKPHTLTFLPIVTAPTFRTVNVSTRVYLSSGTDSAQVGEAVREAVRDFFAAQLSNGAPNPQIDFGANILQADGSVVAEIAWSDVFNAVRDVPGVRKVDEGGQGLTLNLLRSSIVLGPREFPILGTTQVINADTNAGI